jgi:hypothetical protein
MLAPAFVLPAPSILSRQTSFSMRFSRPVRTALLPVLGLFLFAACESPTEVGRDLIGEDGGRPRTVTFAPDTIEVFALPRATGGFFTPGITTQSRALAGNAADPLVGTIRTGAWLDFSRPTAFPDGFEERDLTRVDLMLRADYAYGDTTTTTTLSLYSVPANWDPAGATADTTFQTGDLITTFEVRGVGDSLMVQMPASWIAANDTTLRSAAFNDLFHGFHIRAQTDDGAAYGFPVGTVRMRALTAQDTVTYSAFKTFTSVVRDEAPAPLPADRILIQGGTAPALRLVWSPGELANAPLNTSLIRLDADTTLAYQNLPGGFIRPLARQLTLFGEDAIGQRIALATATLDQTRSAYLFGSTTLTTVLQDILVGQSIVRRFVVMAPLSPLNLSIVPLVNDELDAERRPRALIVVSEPGT